MSGPEFWFLVLWTCATGWTFYLIGYRTGWTDGCAAIRKWVNK